MTKEIILKSYNIKKLSETITTVCSIISDYENGFVKIGDLADKYGLSYGTVRNVLVDNNVARRKKNSSLSKRSLK